MAGHTQARIEHLKMLQAVIDRMARTSASMKRFALAVAGAALALAASSGSGLIALAAALLMGAFWALDARYLQQEQWFRDLYDEVRTEPAEQAPDYRVLPPAEMRAKRTMSATMFSWSTALLYLPLAAFLLIASVAL
jgi:hypothetical protein